MKGTVKIVTIGGGSSYTPELMEGFIKRYEELPIKEIWLVDIEDGKEKVEIVGALADILPKELWFCHHCDHWHVAKSDTFFPSKMFNYSFCYHSTWICKVDQPCIWA